MAVGAGVIGDIYKLEERGTALGLYLAVSFTKRLGFQSSLLLSRQR